MKNIYKSLVKALDNKGYVKFDPKSAPNKVFLFIEKNKPVLNVETLDNGFIKLTLNLPNA